MNIPTKTRKETDRETFSELAYCQTVVVLVLAA